VKEKKEICRERKRERGGGREEKKKRGREGE